MKRKWIVTGAVLALVLFGVSLVNLSSFKGKIETEASRASGLNVKINGKLHLGIKGLRPALVAHDIHATGQNGRTNITASRISVAMPLSLRPKKFLIGINDFILNDRLLGSYTLPIRLVDGGVEIADLAGTLEKASVKGNFSYVNARMSADLKVKNLDYAVFAKGISGGDADMAVDVTSNGKDGVALIGNLNGTALLSGGEGSMDGSALNLWAGNLITTVMQGQKSETDIECIVTDFAISNGVAASRAIIVDTDKVAIFGNGRINLLRESMNLTFTPKPKEAAFINLAIPVRVVGSFDAPRVEPDPEGLVKKFGGLVFGAIGVLPMFEKGNNIEKPCAAYLESKEKQP